jgi:DNA-binding transcriptional MerR regulator
VGTYSKKDAGRLLKTKVHILRYWEKEVPLIQPSKDKQGHLRYSNRDIQIMLRLKYLINERRFTMEGARDQLYREMAGDPRSQDLMAQIAALRSGLLDLLALLAKDGDR